MVNEYDERQFNRLLEFIAQYEREQLSLSMLVGNIEGLLGSIQGISTAQRNELVRRWGILDEVLALCLDEGERGLRHDEADLVHRALVELRGLCLKYIGA